MEKVLFVILCFKTKVFLLCLSISKDGLLDKSFTRQRCRQVFKSGWTTSNMVGIICSPGWNRDNWHPKFCGAEAHPAHSLFNGITARQPKLLNHNSIMSSKAANVQSIGYDFIFWTKLGRIFHFTGTSLLRKHWQ